jgi:predicted anti-sigma-YlaC factor YlaD
MTCDECRLAWSADRDGEDPLAPLDAVAAHLDGCPPCRDWTERADALARLSRLAAVPAVTYQPAHDPIVLAAVPAPRGLARMLGDRFRRRIARWGRIALGVVGAAQFVLGLAQVTAVGQSVASGAMAGAAADAVSPAHLWHESAAWNLAIGAAFVWVAWRRIRPAGLVPLLTAFVSAIVVLGLGDLLGGLVDPRRLISHGLIVLGYLLVLALSRPEFDVPDPWTDVPGPPRPWRARFDTEPDRPDDAVIGRRPVVARIRTGHQAA